MLIYVVLLAAYLVGPALSQDLAATTKYDSSHDGFPRNRLAEEKRQGKLPDIIFAGAQKAGTMATAKLLILSKLACGAGPQSWQKEPHFWDGALRKFPSREMAIKYYHELYEACDLPLAMDATPATIQHAKDVYQLYKEEGVADTVKIMISLREPVSRQISWYRHMFREYTNGQGDRPFVQQIFKHDGSGDIMEFEEYMFDWILPTMENHDQGQYAKWLQEWFNLFPRENILIMWYDYFKEDPDDFLRRVFSFLDLPVSDGPLVAPHVNSEHVKTEEPIPCSVQNFLSEIYEPLNEDLYHLMESHPGPPEELYPFPSFNFKCVT